MIEPILNAPTCASRRWPTVRTAVTFALLLLVLGIGELGRRSAEAPLEPAALCLVERRSSIENDLAPGQTCTLIHTVGKVRVRPSPDRTCRVRATVRAADHRAADAARRAHGISIRSEGVPGGLVVRTAVALPPAGHASRDPVLELVERHTGVEVNFDVELPAGARLAVRSLAGDVEVLARCAVDIQSLGGRIHLAGGAAPVAVDTVSARVSLQEHGQLDGQSRVRTVSSDVELEAPPGAPRSTPNRIAVILDRASDQSVVVRGSGSADAWPLRVETVDGDVRQRPR